MYVNNADIEETFDLFLYCHQSIKKNVCQIFNLDRKDRWKERRSFAREHERERVRHFEEHANALIAIHVLMGCCSSTIRSFVQEDRRDTFWLNL